MMELLEQYEERIVVQHVTSTLKLVFTKFFASTFVFGNNFRKLRTIPFFSHSLTRYDPTKYSEMVLA